MKFGICLLNSIPLRKESIHKSEMISQVLFGETFKILEHIGGWVQILLDDDNYLGWANFEQILEISEEEYLKIKELPATFIDNLMDYVQIEDALIPISLGSKIPKISYDQTKISDISIQFEGSFKSGFKKKNEIVETAYYFLNAPFLWGGKTPFGIDASGFTQTVYKINGYPLLREAYQQASQGEVLSFIEESEPGDLAFFDDEDGNITHVGIILSNHHIIHSYGKVRIDKLDHSGIYNADLNRHTHKLRVIKQIFLEK